MKRALIATVAGVAVIAVWLITACGSDQEAETKADFKHSKADLMGKVRAAIDSVDLRLSELEAQTTTATEEMSGEMRAQIDTLQTGLVQQLETRKNKLADMMGKIEGATLASLDSLQHEAQALVQETHAILRADDTTVTTGKQGG